MSVDSVRSSSSSDRHNYVSDRNKTKDTSKTNSTKKTDKTNEQPCLNAEGKKYPD